jgi:hypothetical protein
MVRKGRDHDGVQRWLCLDCGRTFRDESDTIITRSKLKSAVWMPYLECFVDCLLLRESFTGNHIRGGLRLPRSARHRGTPASKRGLSKEQICVMTGVVGDGSAFLIMSGRDLISKNRVLAALDGKIARGAYAVADQAVAYPGAMEALSVAFTRTEAGDHAINRINTFHFPVRWIHGRVSRRQHQTAEQVPDMA